MKKGTITKKIPGGKLIRIDIGFSKHIDTIKITGDFFLHPEDTLIQIEEALVGSPIPLDKVVLVNRLQDILDKNNADLIGAAPQDIVDALEEALACPSA